MDVAMVLWLYVGSRVILETHKLGELMEADVLGFYFYFYFCPFG